MSGSAKEFTFRSECSLLNSERFDSIKELIQYMLDEATTAAETYLAKPANPFAARVLKNWLNAYSYEYITEVAKQLHGPEPNGYTISGDVSKDVENGEIVVVFTIRATLCCVSSKGEPVHVYPISILSFNVIEHCTTVN